MSSMSGSGIFVYLPHTEPEHIAQLQTTLYFLYKYYNHQFLHNVYVLTHQPFSNEDIKDRITQGVRESVRKTLHFLSIPAEYLRMPQSADKKIVERCIGLSPSTNWGGLDDRVVEHFWVFNFWKMVQGMGLKYVMKIDYDNIIEEPILEDVFKIAEKNDYDFMFSMLQVESGICCYGLKDFLLAYHKEDAAKREEIKTYFNNARMSDLNSVSSLKQIYKLVYKKDFPQEDLNIDQPIVCCPSFFVMNVGFWSRPEVLRFMKLVENSNNIFYFKWSFASIVSLVTMAYNKEKMKMLIFKMSKRCHRVNAVDINNKSLVSYTQRGCITDK